uniref:Structural maintenance of chromosomes flexible hinge domain-containing protein 1-like isoform X2 n=1 Tax=Actinia tenebrosa TaxID=6105 RepID=A0A6P8HCY5_ACTTE
MTRQHSVTSVKKNITNAVPNGTREQYYANGGRKKTPYKRIKYFRGWMSHIQGNRPVYLDEQVKKKIIDHLEEPTPQGLRRTLKKMKLGKYYKDFKKEGEILQNEEDESIVYVFDRREGNKPEHRVQLGGIFNFAAFREKVCQVLEISSEEKFIFVNTNRQAIEDDKTYESLINDSETIYLLKSVDQELTAPTQERVVFIPHYDTLVKSGMYEYYASEGQNPLPFAFAELVDNALAATAGNEGARSIEVRLMFDDATGRHAVCVMDNGGGMTPRELNNWAIYRLSKFNSAKTNKKPPVDDDVPRSLNSDISYFGVGGKQAIFFIGSATRMVTKTKDCNDVHELSISKEEFERKEKNKESIYSGTIRNRRPGDNSHVPEEEDSVRRLIKEEVDRESFTAVVITGVSSQHSQYLKTQFNQWCRQLAHIYHYYLHGPRGNEVKADKDVDKFKNIDINIVLQEKGKQPKGKALRTVDDDLQTQYIRTSASTFEFRAHVENAGCIEGVLRYHPFLYDRETYPMNESEMKVEEVNASVAADDAMDALEKDSHAPRGYRPIFECYWNGRLIPYTAVDSLEWCQPPKKRTIIPSECYNRFSGVLWTNDAFQVSTNKLTFMDLEVKLKDKNTIFNRVVSSQEQRVQISKAFHDWIKECHENHDKQIKFSNFQGQVKRPELTQKKNQSPWSVFNAIEWDGKVFKAGQLIRTIRTIPYICGTVKRFLLFGDFEGDVFATGGEMEIVQEPVSLYGENKVFPLAKLDRTLTTAQVKKFVEEEESKLPSRLVIAWPEGNKLDNNSKIPAGTTIGAMKVDIVNGKNEPINKLPGDRRKLLVELKVIWHGSDKEGDKVITNLVCQHGGKNWPYWFRKMENITQLGPHSLALQVIVSESSTVQAMKGLPSNRIKFTVTEAKPDKFTFGMLDIPLRVGLPFQIPLNLFDEFNNPSKFSQDILPVLSASGLELSFSGTSSKGNSLIIKGVVAVGTIPSHAGKDFNLKVTLPGLEEDSQSLKIRLLPGPPYKLVATPAEPEITIENGNQLQLNVQVQDKAGNVTVNPRLNVVCKLSSQPNLPTYTGDCSSSGKCSLTGPDISLRLHDNKAMKIKAKIELQHHKEVAPIEKTVIVTPSTNAGQIIVFHQASGSKQKLKLEDGQDLSCVVGSTITGLSFKILDEGDRELPLDNTLINKLKVNWIQKTNKEMLKQGNLPEVKAPTSASESKYCQVHLIGSVGLDFSFTLKPTPDEPFILKCTCANPKLRFGEPLQSEIIVLITDRYGNKITKLPPGALKLFHVSAPGLKEKEVGIGLSQSGSIVIKNIQFESGSLGPKELTIQWEKLKYYLRLEVVAGVPAKLALVNVNTTEPLSVYNNTAIPVPLVVQLCDEMGNAAAEADIKVVLNTDKGVKLTPNALQQKTNAKGQASFGQPVVSAPRGVYGIRIKALCQGRSHLEAPVINLRLEPDPSKPVKLNVTFNKNAPCQVGELLPVVSAHVVAEDDSILKAASAKDVVLKIWHTKDGPPSEKPPPRATTLYPSRKAAGDKEGEFYFRDLKVPDVSGPHCMVVQYGPGGALSLTSKMITFTAQAGPPVRLEPESVPPTPTVSNTSRITGRCLVKTLKLQLKDKYDNLSGEKLQGKVTIKVISIIDGIDEIPSLANASRNNQIEIPLVKGTATVQNLYIQENTNGKDGQEYVLNFQAVLPSKATPHPVPPFTLAFLFYNDVRKQQQMAQLTKERDNLFETIRTYRSLFDTTRQLIQEMRVSVHEAAQEEQKLKAELKKHNVAEQHLGSVRGVESYLATVVKKRDELAKAPRRQCNLNPGPRGDPEILGKVAHLAQVADDDVARVLSWHMASDMDCVVTLTTAKAKEVYRDSNGQQQVLPLDSIYKQRLPEWNRPLPHIRNGPRNYNPPGNPVYARDKLIFPAEAANCKIVFGMLLGDTIILDDLDCANKYRQEVVKYTHCPTILTRSGDRIRSNGKFGGLQNKAPVLERMRGAVFAAPVPTSYSTLSTQIEQLQAYKQAQIKHQQAKSDLELQLQQGQTDQMKIKHRECHDAETQLRMIEERLGMTPTQYDMPASPATMLHTELSTPLSRSAIANGRIQESSSPVLNGTASNTRTRRASPLNSEEPRSSKRIRKS